MNGLHGRAGGFDIERNASHSLFCGEAFAGEPGGAKHVKHPAILGEGVGRERCDAFIPCVRGQVLQQQAGDTASLVFVGNHKGDVSTIGRSEAFVTSHRNDLIAKHGDKGHTILIVDGREALHLRIAEVSLGCEKAQVHALRREFGEERAICHRIVWPYGTDVYGTAIAEDGIHLPVGRVLARRRLSRVHLQTRVPDAGTSTRL